MDTNEIKEQLTELEEDAKDCKRDMDFSTKRLKTVEEELNGDIVRYARAIVAVTDFKKKHSL